MDLLQTLSHPFASVGAFLIWLAAVSAAGATIWRTWLRHVFRRLRQGVEAVIELRDLLKTELHLPGDGEPGVVPRTSLREDLQAVARALASVAVELTRGSQRFNEHEGRLAGHDERLGGHDEQLTEHAARLAAHASRISALEGERR